MSKLIRRFLNLIFNLGLLKKHYKIVWDIKVSGEILSANKFYAGFNSRFSKTGKHIPAGVIRAAIKNDYEKRFNKLIEGANIGTLNEFSIVVFYRTRHDCDNISLMSKILIDTLKGRYIKNDGNKIYKSIHIVRDESISQGTIHFHLIGN